MNVGVDVKRVRLVILITVSLLIGTCVSIGGTIGFVGLVTPHIIRLMTGPNHRRLLPASMFGGAVFLTLDRGTRSEPCQGLRHAGAASV